MIGLFLLVSKMVLYVSNTEILNTVEKKQNKKFWVPKSHNTCNKLSVSLG